VTTQNKEGSVYAVRPEGSFDRSLGQDTEGGAARMVARDTGMEGWK
jgi:hypothetical protein